MTMIINPYIFGTSVAPVVEPSVTAAMRLWLKSNVGVTASGVGALVSDWADQSGNSNNAVEVPSSSRPSLLFADAALNNYSAISFQAGGDDGMSIPASASLNFSANGFTIYIVANVSSWFSSYATLLQHSNGSTWTQGWGIMAVPGSNIRFFLNNWNNVANYIDLPVPPVNKKTLFKFQWNKASSSFVASYFQGASGSSQSNSKPFTLSYTNPVEAFQIMRGGAGTTIYDTTGKFGEILMYDGVTSVGDDTIVQNYLIEKYNIV